MKKEIFNIALISIILLGIMFALMGCGNELKSNKDVKKYFREYYSGEKFEILGRKEIVLKEHENGSKINGYEYSVKAKKSNIEFSIRDTYEFRPGLGYLYGIENNYVETATEKYINDYADKRLQSDNKFYSNDSDCIKLNITDFSSNEEMANLLYNFKQFLFSKEPFNYSDWIKVRTYYYIYDENEECITYFGLNKINSIDDIYNYLK